MAKVYYISGLVQISMWKYMHRKKMENSVLKKIPTSHRIRLSIAEMEAVLR